ncbi:hypothetical protein GLAREA_07585 [Glarea lozoyensis ATCC 20868]|uniref:Uncharacterized protein n=1 Tax=Glarea lozoyensis (strain ATCC 20868 / MF5171) TaxID=1116229 RepID=S3D1M8_GLAL2|nr:uncharacterized protein GLAREA_07585 [Glarea lozoyensis ATCC 20868]EPE32452.1 hypothetical protein GLAREA_07585 [Glarea lozoyensis ATCC 20868]
MAQPEKSPSPPPPVPTPLTPGPRATAFTTLYSKTLTATLNAISYDAFAACFPEIARKAPGALRVFHGQFLGRLEGLAVEEFNTILTERNVVSNLNKLESIISSARYLKTTADSSSTTTTSQPPPPPHTLPPSALLTAHLKPHLAAQQSHLNAKLQTVESMNATLADEIEGQKKEIERLMRGLGGLVGDLEDASVEVGGRGQELAGEGRGVEGLLG